MSPCGPADDAEDQGPEARGAGPAPMRNDSRITSTNDDGFRRIEVITGVGRRRRWTDEEKAWIVAESLDPTTTTSAVARRYGLHPSQLFVWREQVAAPAAREVTGFVPVGVAEDGTAPAGRRAGSGSRSARRWCGSGRAWTRRRCAGGARGGAGAGVIAVPPGVRIL